MAQNKTHYETLGVSRHAGPDAIRDAYRGLARTLHPDMNADPVAHGVFKDVTAAYNVLRDPNRRQAYDEELAQAALSSVRGSGTTGNGPQTTGQPYLFVNLVDAIFGAGRQSSSFGSSQRMRVTRRPLQTVINDAREHMRYGNTERAGADVEEAVTRLLGEASIEEATRLDSEFTEHLIEQAKLHMRCGNTELARKLVNKIVKRLNAAEDGRRSRGIYDEFTDHLIGSARTHMRFGNTDHARSLIDDARKRLKIVKDVEKSRQIYDEFVEYLIKMARTSMRYGAMQNARPLIVEAAGYLEAVGNTKGANAIRREWNEASRSSGGY